MKRTDKGNIRKDQGWLLFFYSVPSKPVSNRMKIWRKLSKAGAVQIKGAVYILPMNEEHYEFFQWLVSEVSSMGGEAAFTRVDSIDSMKDQEIMDLFNKHKELEYHGINKVIEGLEAKVNSVKKGSKTQNLKALSEQIAKASKSYEEGLKTDFFSSKAGALLLPRLNALNAGMKGFLGTAPETKPAAVPSRKPADYQGKIWVSRKRPFVDRMASAWLIRRFIDKGAKFGLLDETELAAAGKGSVTFDLRGGAFTHVGDLCTFEVLVKSFGIKDRAVKKIAELVHEIDVRDDRYRAPEAQGIESLLSGIRKTAKDDMECLERGVAVFEMLYASKI
ncbi:MAG TPA: chromate resistance protein ChrB domain-containing protein [Thermodesulfovibrionales bacterium]|jgi:hypothetical protein|nr:chromate resistance protein ChrB domain-containing protein [Thermodesulfovibrionales bacterium]